MRTHAYTKPRTHTHTELFLTNALNWTAQTRTQNYGKLTFIGNEIGNFHRQRIGNEIRERKKERKKEGKKERKDRNGAVDVNRVPL